MLFRLCAVFSPPPKKWRTSFCLSATSSMNVECAKVSSEVCAQKPGWPILFSSFVIVNCNWFGLLSLALRKQFQLYVIFKWPVRGTYLFSRIFDWSPSPESFLLSFFNTVGAGKIFWILCGIYKVFFKNTLSSCFVKTTHTCAIKFIRYILDLYPQVGKDFLINRIIDASMGRILFS